MRRALVAALLLLGSSAPQTAAAERVPLPSTRGALVQGADPTTNADPVITVRTEGNPPGFLHDLAIRDGLAVDNTTSAANSSSSTPLSTSSPSSSSSSSIPITWILIFLIPALVVVGIVLFCRFSCGRKRRKVLEQQQAEDEELAVQQQALQARPRDSDWSGASDSEISGADDDDERIRRTR